MNSVIYRFLLWEKRFANKTSESRSDDADAICDSYVSHIFHWDI